MTPKEKAAELVAKYKDAPFNCKGCDMPFCDTPCTMLSIYEAKQCALIAVDEILNNFGNLTDGKHYCNYATVKFYKEVREEIENL